MLIPRYVLLLIFIFSISAVFGQQSPINFLDSGKKTSLRGLSVVNDKIIWASGSNGTVARSTDAGKNFTWQSIKGYEQRDFRDIEAFDSNTAVIMAVAEPAIILKTRNGGQSWYKVFEDTSEGMFLDAMDFDEDGINGIVVGDPLPNQHDLYFAMTSNKGESWRIVTGNSDKFQTLEGEAMFASSGTNIQYPTAIITGGSHSRLFYNGTHVLPIIQGKESTGANSIAINEKGTIGVIVGGDFSNDQSSADNCVLVKLQYHPKFTIPQTPPHGYRSCVIFVSKNTWVTCGTTGVDISTDGGLNWNLISNESFHVVQKAKKGKSIYLAGKNGRIARLEE